MSRSVPSSAPASLAPSAYPMSAPSSFAPSSVIASYPMASAHPIYSVAPSARASMPAFAYPEPSIIAPVIASVETPGTSPRGAGADMLAGRGRGGRGED